MVKNFKENFTYGDGLKDDLTNYRKKKNSLSSKNMEYYKCLFQNL